jgi:hypothetical protein
MHPHHPHFIIVTDRGALRAGWLTPPVPPQNPSSSLKRPSGLERPHSIRWVEDLAFVHPRQHLVEQVSDMAGAYSAAESSGGGGPSSSQPRRMGSSFSEVHWRIAADRQAVEDLARAAAAVLFREKPESWSLAAPEDIHLALLEALPSICRVRLERVLPKNLARSTVESIAKHFLGS